MSRAHTLVRRVSWGGADLHALVSEAVAAFQSGARTNIEVRGDAIFVVPELTQSLALIIHELATNAIKYGALSTPEGSVTIAWSKVDGASDRLRFEWHERGGPPTSPPSQEGFGLTVLNAAAQDLGAKATCDFKASGLVYTLEGPFQMTQSASAGGPKTEIAQPKPGTASRSANGKPCRVLVVEDEGLVALQLRADLEDAGHFVVGPARSLAQGLALAEEKDIDAALIDVRLGRDSSVPIADRLLARSIPFAFATGYADMTMLPDHLRAIPRLSKPYAPQEIRRIMHELCRD
jgi:CheY-like chemotaxis protein